MSKNYSKTIKVKYKTTERKTMPRPTVFRDKTKYNRQAHKLETKRLTNYLWVIVFISKNIWKKKERNN